MTCTRCKGELFLIYALQYLVLIKVWHCQASSATSTTFSTLAKSAARHFSTAGIFTLHSSNTDSLSMHTLCSSTSPHTSVLNRTHANVKGHGLCSGFLSNVYLSATTTKCPSCKVRIQRAGGCPHMTCTRCQKDFCYYCGGDWCGSHRRTWSMKCHSVRYARQMPCGEIKSKHKPESSFLGHTV